MKTKIVISLIFLVVASIILWRFGYNGSVSQKTKISLPTNISKEVSDIFESAIAGEDSANFGKKLSAISAEGKTLSFNGCDVSPRVITLPYGETNVVFINTGSTTVKFLFQNVNIELSPNQTQTIPFNTVGRNEGTKKIAKSVVCGPELSAYVIYKK